jgi:hypothetical protein
MQPRTGGDRRCRHQGRLGEQRPADEHVEQALEHARAHEEHRPPREPPNGPRQQAERPEDQEQQEIADQRLGHERQDGDHRRGRSERIGRGPGQLTQHPELVDRGAHHTHELPFDQQQAGGKARYPPSLPPGRPWTPPGSNPALHARAPPRTVAIIPPLAVFPTISLC